MATLEKPLNEIERLKALGRYNLLDTPPDGTFDRLTAMASAIFNVPISIISLVDHDRIWFKSHHGIGINQIDRDPGLCASAILSDHPYVVENAANDPRTLTNPLVAGDFGLRFYAAAPLRTTDHYNLGTLCLLDKEPRTFNEDQRKILTMIADIVMEEMDRRLTLITTVSKVRSLTSDISYRLKETIKSVEGSAGDNQPKEIVSYLDSARMFIQNIQNQLNQL